MKRIFILLLIACSTISVNADSSIGGQKRPEKVISNLNAIISLYGHKEGQSFALNRNPNTGIIESSEKIATFSCNHNCASFEAIAGSFMADEPLCYQILHLVPGNTEKFTLKVVTNERTKNVFLRMKPEQEMWLMCTKNPENPQLRDAYAIVWEEVGDNFGDTDVEGTVYMITSLRPDIYEKNLQSSKNTFKIEGRVDENIKDSLYNIYIADTREALYALDEDDYVACVPVVNKRFEFQTELDHPMAGRLRCIFPDGELCSAWIDLDFVPGETYRITVHNGYYDEDKDYERRVGRNSGRSIISPSRSSDTFVADTLEIDSLEDIDNKENDDFNWQQSMSREQLAKGVIIGKACETDTQIIDDLYNSIKEMPSIASDYSLDVIYKQIINQNKSLDVHLKELVNFVKDTHMPAKAMRDLYKGILDTYIVQNKKYNELGGKNGTKQARKLQKYINKLTEKYLSEMTKL